LHGFPQFWYTWRHQIPALAAHFQVVAPDLRGYNETERPLEIDAYSPNKLVADVEGLIHGLGFEKGHIIGHDWGGAIAWNVALTKPEVVDRLVVINSPHPRNFRRALQTNYRQLLRSWYMFLFRIPYLPEKIFQIHPKWFLERILKGIRKETFTKEDIQQYLQPLLKPGAFTAALNYYRAAFREIKKSERRGKIIAAPTLLIWGEEDVALGKELTEEMEGLFSSSFNIEYISNCSHWVQEEQPEKVNELLLNFLLT
jgi:pimeloyl-ACP methyl ester carboxylesterase